MIIKVLLVASVLVVAVYVLRGPLSGRHLVMRRLAGLSFAAVWIVAVLFPDWVTAAANLVGVGRGTDLVLYLLAVAFVFNTIAQAQHFHRLDERVSTLTRALALSSESRKTPEDVDD